MTGRPLVSVLMPLAPEAAFLSQALASIRDQTLTGWELVAVLDGACPHNEKLLRRIIPATRLRIVERSAPVGIAAALKDGLRHCRSDLVARMDADDVSLPGRLRRQRDFLLGNPAVVAVGSSVHIIDERGRRRYVRRMCATADLRRRLLLRNQLVHPSVMFRREAVDAVGGYDERLSGGEDYELWLRLSTAGVLTNLDDPLLEHRVWDDQFSRTVDVAPLVVHILRARRAAAAHLGVPAPLVLGAHAGWRIVQSRTAHWALRTARTAGRAVLTPPQAAVRR
ncbi:glycosyltransferase [Actinomadura sp. WMMA1423]|uniref:glycosyltransferase n=1 Tax=Actinomadura sp. WMMA1423 TaxID=2591108 RepID=UPI0011463F6F|nr:glycosyltransferase [Actinomadura sp. WMMA1423]